MRHNGKKGNRGAFDFRFPPPDVDDYDFKSKPVIKSLRFPRELAREILAISQEEGVNFTRALMVLLRKSVDNYRAQHPRSKPLPDFPAATPRKRRSKRDA